MVIVTRYILFAAVATGINIGTQRLALLLYQGRLALPAAMVLGTGTGLLVKYLLDKRYIFNFTAETKGRDLLTFFLYSLMGVATTGIFWITELLFDKAFPFEAAKYIGAVTGLAVGYTMKYFLDRRFVFRQRDTNR